MQDALDYSSLPDLFLCRAVPFFLSYDSFLRESYAPEHNCVECVFFNDLVN